MANIGRLVLLSIVLFFGPAAFSVLIKWLQAFDLVSNRTLGSWGIAISRNDAERDGAHRAITPELWKYVESLRTKAGVPGMAFGVVKLRESDVPETEFGAWGLKTEDGDSITPDTLYSIASCSKAFVSASLGLLIDDFASGRNRTGLPPSITKLTWDTKVASLLPISDWGLQDPYATAKASLRDVLSHRSGLGGHALGASTHDNTVDIIKRMRFLKSPYELREKFQYNNQMYSVVAHIISIYAGQPFPDFVSERVFKPLNMTDSTYDAVRAEQSGKLSHGWSPTGRRIPFWRLNTSVDVPDGPAGVLSSAIDMTRWVATLINGGINPWTNTSVIPESVVQETTTSITITTGRAPAPELSLLGYAMAWHRSTYRGHEIVAHDGITLGFNTFVIYLPWDKIGIVGFASVDGSVSTISEAAHRIIDHILGLPPLNHSPADAAPKKNDETQDTPPPAEHPPVPDMNGGTQVRNAEFPVPLEAFAGTYQNPGYGSLTLCAPTSTSEHCKNVLATFASIPTFRSVQDPLAAPAEQGNLSFNDVSPSFRSMLRPGVYGYWPRWVSSHIAFLPLSSTSHPSVNASALPPHAFSVAFPSLYPHGFGRDTTPFASYAVGLDGSFGWFGPRAECEVVDGWVTGCGLFLEPLSIDEERSILERAETWFSKH
ncbi:beta-lactamase/transpeptidase-like protein [Obba rivulosa]|uniref:Beta-lactamase/transpeptidase-like protein n=1 Tax=Obba rivulosa TaxID=1052685 RepID=A0A8E2B0R6_9APHY|nr:beta-lactamase/transpeptidase-like protein [Obba rivulosa]